MKKLTKEQLNDECLLILENARLKYPSYSTVLSLLYDYGFRVNEIDLLLNGYIDGTSLVVQTSKKGSPRFIPFADLPVLVQQSINTGNISFYIPKYRTFLINFRLIAGKRFKNKGKNISTHIFRHNRIKQLSIDHHDLYIKNWFGFKSDTIVEVYKESSIFTY